ncbi:MAG TPA: biopolymer transporter ExbD [Planctomycetota bacterium]|nr:biopolymer transporter ExbD [Planctomycetota bacterium]
MLIHPGKRVQTTRLNMTPMIDCVFLLLTFFMVVSELTRQYDAIEVQLPRIRASTEIPADPYTVKLAADGAIYWNGEKVTLQRLGDDLRWLRYNNPDLAVVLKADERVEFRHIRAILNLCADRRIKVWRLAFGARPPDDQADAQEDLR